MYRIILEHNEEYREKCWHSGCEGYPNNRLSLQQRRRALSITSMKKEYNKLVRDKILKILKKSGFEFIRVFITK
jgi:hypothetical protein